MDLVAQVFSLLFFIIHTRLLSGDAKTLTITNNCTYTIWPAVFGPNLNGDSGFALLKGESRVIVVQSGWTGKVWGRTLCLTNKSTAGFSCQTGDCSTGSIECAGGLITYPVTLAKFSISLANKYDFYDVSVVDGYNLPIMVAPNVESGAGCDITGCMFDLEKLCGAELSIMNGSSIIGCRGLCEADKNCCKSQTGCPGKNSSLSPLVYKKPCPRAYSFAVDDEDGTFMCDGSKVSTYNITFCPSPTMSRLLSVPSSQAVPPAPATTIPESPPSIGLLPSSLMDPPSDWSSDTTDSNSHISLIPALPITIVLVILLGICLGCFYRLRRTNMKQNITQTVEIRRSVDCLHFDFNIIQSATLNFAAENKLGEGGFGDVYKGKLEDGQEVAVKRLSKNSGQGIAEFETEIVLVAKLQHKNLVRLLGYCAAPQQNLLVYEFLPNLSLDKFLFDPVKKSSLDWQTRLKIIAGIARGLLYLHEDSRLKVVHRDLKTSNILLDEAMNPKIADFGLARLFGVDQTQGDTRRIVGTYGYMAPEYAITGHYSVKSDVFSFGVIVLEIVSGQRNRLFTHLQNFEALLHRAWRLWNEGEALSLVDAELENSFEREKY